MRKFDVFLGSLYYLGENIKHRHRMEGFIEKTWQVKFSGELAES